MRLRFVPAALCALLLGACNDGAGPGAAVALEVLDGDEQGGLPGELLGIRVHARSASGGNGTGVSVAWVVTSGDATISPPSGAVDANGEATAVVTLGATPGPVVVTATAAGLTPVQFNLQVDPCNYLPVITLGITSNGILNRSDCAPLGDNSAVDFWDLGVGATQNVLITMTAGYRGYLWLQNTSGIFVGLTVDAPVDSVVSLRALMSPGHWIILANSFFADDFGGYRVRAEAQALDAGCLATFVTRGINVQQTTPAAACTWNSQPTFDDHFLFWLETSQTVQVTVTGTAFAATVNIGGPNLAILATATAAGPGQPATASFTPSSGNLYFLEVKGGGTSGAAYQLAVQ